MPAVVDQEKCDGCKSCEEICPSSSIAVREDGFAVVVAEDCIDCAACVGECIHGALSMAD
jgi:NAD-dependent dihydropyrimidine dehydrogenase PreA subunit